MADVFTPIGMIKGPQGATGATGQTGAQGPAATIAVGSVSTTAYGNPAQVTNTGTSSAAVFNFTIPQGKPGEKTTKMGELTLDTITTSVDSFPSPAVNDTGATAFGKIVKFFSDALTRFSKHTANFGTVSASTTTQNFSAGDFLVNNDQLYKVTSNIASGGTITPGTNVTATDVGTQLTSLNDSLKAIFAVKVHTIASIPVAAQAEVDLTVSGYTVIGVRFQNADNTASWGIGKNQHFYVKYNNGFTYQNIEVYAYYVKSEFLHTLS